MYPVLFTALGVGGATAIGALLGFLVFIHEGGHCLFGYLNGFKFIS